MKQDKDKQSAVFGTYEELFLWYVPRVALWFMKPEVVWSVLIENFTVLFVL